ncbi:MAG: AbrB/MazE/SpoVT family DNA-binding domain-containing protein [Thermoplasmatales archaeon]|nr:AbrB/MazE/SpoVT family DNA-binding domain-containing protein [Thermoplasmatales archaeon]
MNKVATIEIKKLVQAGYTGVAVVVPAFWRKFWELQKGDEIEVTCDGNTMTVIPVKTIKKKKGDKKNEK